MWHSLVDKLRSDSRDGTDSADGDEGTADFELTEAEVPVRRTDANAALVDALTDDRDVEVSIVWEPSWSPEFMSDRGKERLGGLGRMGLVTMAPPAKLAMSHGALIANGFFGTVISLERAVALDRPVVYAIPGAAALGTWVSPLATTSSWDWVRSRGPSPANGWSWLVCCARTASARPAFWPASSPYWAA